MWQNLVTVHTNLPSHAQSRRLRLLSRCFAAKIANAGEGYLVTQHLRAKTIFSQVNLSNLLLALRCRVNSNKMITIFLKMIQKG